MNEVLNINGTLYKVYRVVNYNPDWNIELLKSFWHCTHAFRKENMLYFCREIPEAKYEEFS